MMSRALSVPATLSHSVSVHLRRLPTLLATAAAVALAMVLALLLTLVIATPSTTHVADLIAAGTYVSSWQLVAVTGWALIPLAVMIWGAAVALQAATVVGAAPGGTRRVSTLVAVGTRRAITGLCVCLVIGVVLFALTLGAPVVSVVFLLLAGLRAAGVARIGRFDLPQVRTGLLLAIPLAASVTVIARWFVAVPVAFATTGTVRGALSTSASLTRPQRRWVTLVAILGVGGVAVVTGAVIVGAASVPWGWSLAIQAALAALVGPFPAVLAAVTYRLLGGEVTVPLVDAPRRLRLGGREVSRAMPAGLAIATAFTLIVPVWGRPAAAEPGEIAVVTLDETSGVALVWDFGSTVPIAGTVTAQTGGGAVPTGSVALHVTTSQGTTTAGTVTLEAGTFVFDRLAIAPGATSMTVAYAGDADYAAASAPAQAIQVRKATLSTPQITIHAGPDGIAVGDSVLISADFAATGGSGPIGPTPVGGLVPGFPITGTAQFADSVTSASLASVPVTGTAAEFSYLVTTRRIGLIAWLDDPYYQVNGGESPPFTDVRPGDVTLGLSVPATARLGERITAIITVDAGPGVPVDGVMDLAYGGATGTGYLSPFSGIPIVNGVAALEFCVGTGATCAAGPYLPLTSMVGSSSIRAIFTPTYEQYEDRQLNPAESTAVTIVRDDSTPGASDACMRVVLDVNAPAGMLAAGRDRLQPTLSPSFGCTDHSGDEPLRGFAEGDVVTLAANVPTGFEFVNWTLWSPQGTQVIGTAPHATWSVPAGDADTTFFVNATYRLRCMAVTYSATPQVWAGFSPTSHPYFDSSAMLDCALADGRSGAVYGSQMLGRFSPNGPQAELFYSMTGSTPVTVTPATRDSRTHKDFTFTLTNNVHFTATYGRECHEVHGSTADAAEVTVLTSPNCFSPYGDGFVAGTVVELEATVTDPYASLTGWTIDGQVVPSMGAGSRAFITVEKGFVPELGVELLACYPVTVTTTERPFGIYGVDATASAVQVSAPTCPDGSDRWLAETTATLTAVPGKGPQEVMQLGAWVVTNQAGESVTTRLGDGNSIMDHTVTVDGPLSVEASFFNPDLCSTFEVSGAVGFDDIVFEDPQPFWCGPGRYVDRSYTNLVDDLYDENLKVNNQYILDNETWRYPYTGVRFTVKGDLLNVSAKVNNAFGARIPGHAPVSDYTTSPVTCDPQTQQCTADIRGNVYLTVYSCQAVVPQVSILVAGDQTGTVYGPAAFGLDGFEFVRPQDSVLVRQHECGVRGSNYYNQFLTGKEVTLRAAVPALGFEFSGWGEVDNAIGVEVFTGAETVADTATGARIPVSPLGMILQTDTASPRLTAEVTYIAHCAKVTFGGGVRPITPPNCPGAVQDDMTQTSRERTASYVVGSFIVVRADDRYNGRYFGQFTDGVIPGSVGLDEQGYPSAMVLVDGNMFVDATYPGATAKLLNQLAIAGKYAVGFASLAVTAAVPMLCPPCGVALSVLAASAYLLDMIPGIGNVASTVFKAINPLTLLECSAAWGFDTGDYSTSAEEYDLERYGSYAKGAVVSVRFMYNVYDGGLDEAITRAQTGGFLSKAGAGASFVVGLAANQVWEMNGEYRTAGDLRNTSGWNQCLKDKYT